MIFLIIVIFMLLSPPHSFGMQKTMKDRKEVYSNMMGAMEGSSFLRPLIIKYLWNKYKYDQEFRMIALQYATQTGRIKYINKFLNEGEFISDQLTAILESVFKLGLCVTCCTCTRHSIENHSKIIVPLLEAGADGDKIKIKLEGQSTNVVGAIEYQRNRNSLDELDKALKQVKPLEQIEIHQE